MRPLHPRNCSVSLGRSLDGSLPFFFFCCLPVSFSRFLADLCVSRSRVLLVSRSLALPMVLALSLAGFTRLLSRPLARSLASSLSRSLALLLFRSLVFFSLSPCLARLLACFLAPSRSCFLAGPFPPPLSLSRVCCSLPDSCALSHSGLSARSLSRFRVDARTALR